MVANLKISAATAGTIFVLLATFISMKSTAAPLPDPTRPPFVSGTQSGHYDHGAVTVTAPRSSGLQFIIITPEHRAAIINGRNVTLGGKYGDSTLVEINEGSVVLQDVQGKRITYNMFPGVGIKANSPAVQPPPGKADTGTTIIPAPAASSPQAAPQEEK
jgi:hypothetical protein